MDATQSDTHKSRKRDHTGRTAILTLALALVLIASAGFFILNSGSTDADGHTHDNITFIEWTSSTSLPNSAGSYYLNDDVTLESTWTVPSGTTNLCLNGKSITMNGSDTAISIGSEITLNLYECQENSGAITHGEDEKGSKYGGCGVSIDSTGTFNMYGGTITGNNAANGGGVYICNNSTFHMEGGTISDNTATEGGGVYICNNSTFYMYGGTITGNNAVSGGGGVLNDGTSTFHMESGTITGNSANVGGGVLNNYTLSLNGSPVVSDNFKTGEPNTPSNVSQPDSKTIIITGLITNGARIGITTGNTGDLTTGYKTQGNSCDPACWFFSDDKTKGITWLGDSPEEAKLISGDENHLICEGFAFKKIADTSLPNSAGSYYLNDDVTLESTWTVPSGTTNLCLNGHSITMKQNTYTDSVPVIKVDNGNTLNLYDCSNPSTGKITHYSETADNNTVTWMGSGLYVGGLDVGGTFNMYGGSISGNIIESGGGVYTYPNSTFNMYGGTISENTANNGGGVYNDGTFNMYGGTISENNATDAMGGGGGVFNSIKGTFNIYGGTVSNNTATTYGGGVYNYKTFNMNGGTISSNTATNGGGVFIENYLGDEKFTMYGGTISNNSAEIGGGVYFDDFTIYLFLIKGSPVISDNFRTGNQNVPSNVFIPDNQKITINGLITNGARIGITTGNTGDLTTGYKNSGNICDPACWFFSDDKTKGITWMGDSPTEAKLITKDTDHLIYDGIAFKKISSLPDSAGSYYLDNDIALTSTWAVPSGTTNLCLNGKSITMNGSDTAISIGSEITLNLYECQENSGAITHGQNKTGRGVSIDSNGTFNMYGGTISGNTVSDDLRGGGGVDINGGAFNMYGGTISENRSTSYGGGVFVDHGTFSIEGSPVISGNLVSDKTDNVYLSQGEKIKITNALTEGADIGISMKTPEEFTSDYSKYNTADPSTFFKSDNTSYSVSWNDGKTEAELGSSGSNYTVTYKLDNETYGAIDTVASGAEVTVRDKAVKEGYTVSDWTSADVTIENGKFIMPEKNVTITATSKINTYTATFDLKGGSVTSQPSGWALSEGKYTKNFNYGTSASLIIQDFGDYSREGYVKGKETVSSETMGTTGMTITANWTPVTVKHHVTYDTDGGSEDAPTQEDVAEGGTFKVAAYSGTKSGCTFGGWTCNGQTYQPGYELTMGTSDMVLKAKWDAVKHHVTYDTDGGSAAAPTQEDVAEGGTFKVAAYSGTKSGYDFGGWTCNGQTYQPGYELTMGTSDMAFKAKWDEIPVPTKQYTVTISAGEGGTVSRGSVTVDSGTMITSADDMLMIGSIIVTATPSEGYEFSSWTGVTSSVVTSDMNVAANFSKEGEKTWSISYSLEKGSWKEGYTAPTQYTEGVGTSLPSSSDIVPYTKDGYTVSFLGWYLTGDKSKTIVSSVTPTDSGDKSFTAFWEEKVNSYAYTVNYQDAAGRDIAPSYEGTAEFGTKVTPEIISVPGYVPPKDTKTITISSDESKNTVTYVYTVITFTITVSSGDHGTITGPTTVEYGSDAIFAIIGDDDYIISDVTVDGESVGKKGVYTFASVTSDHTISAAFEYKKDAETVIDDVGNIIEIYTEEQDGKDVRVAIHYNADGETESYASVSVSEDINSVVSVISDTYGKTVVETTAMITSDTGATITLSDLNSVKEAAASAAKSLDVDANDKMNIVVDSTTEAGTSKGASISFEGVSSDNTLAITVLGDAGSISFDSKVIADVLKTASAFNVVFEEADDSSITPEQRRAAGNNTVYDIFAVVNGMTMTTFDGDVKISMPYDLKEEEEPTDVKIYYVSDEGNVELIGGNWSNGYVTAKLSHFSDYFAAADYVLRNVTLEKTGEGSVEASTYSCSPGTTVKLTATPSDGWKFVKWESQQVTVNDGSFVMPDKDVTVKAVFEKASGSSSGFNWWWILIIVAVIACIVGGFWFYNSRKA